MNNTNNDHNKYEKATNLLDNQISKTKSSILQSSLQRKNTIQSMQTYLFQIGIQNWNIPFIHITGSKGKGSTASFAESILRNHYNYNTGLFTSPHLINVNERIRVNGKPVCNDIFANAYLEVRRRLLVHNNEEDLPTYFRMLTLVALFIFQHYKLDDNKIDVIILEVGMGGRYDATNILPKVIGNTPFVCGVTMIDYEHTRILGDTLEEIAAEKGGIFRHSFYRNGDFKYFYTIDTNTTSVLNVLENCTRERLNDDDLNNYHPCEKLNIVSIDTDQENDFIGIPGKHQQINAQLAYHLSKSLHEQIFHSSSDPKIDENKSISKAIETTFWPARCHTIQFTPSIYLHIDGAHTVPSIKAYLSWLCSTHLTSSKSNVILIFNCSHEKNPISIVHALQQTLLEYNLVSVYFCYPDSERPSMISKPTTLELLHDIQNGNNDMQYDDSTWQTTLANVWRNLLQKDNDTKKHNIITNLSVSEALEDINSKYNDTTHVCITGSLYIAGSALKVTKWEEEYAEGCISF